MNTTQIFARFLLVLVTTVLGTLQGSPMAGPVLLAMSVLGILGVQYFRASIELYRKETGR